MRPKRSHHTNLNKALTAIFQAVLITCRSRISKGLGRDTRPKVSERLGAGWIEALENSASLANKGPLRVR